MDFLKTTEKMMSMNDATWKRHANPWSVYTRIAILPLLILAIWSRVWLGWFAVVPVAIVCFWIWYNPRAFGVPKSTRNWASRAVMGERLYLAKKQIPIAIHHLRVCNVLILISLIGTLVMIYGLIVLNLWMTVCGASITMLGKLWFLDRMVWIFRDKVRDGDEFALQMRDSK